jgi:hypothetical protein
MTTKGAGVAHAVVLQVKLADGGESEDGRKMLVDLVVPNAKAQPGFQHGIWMNDGGNGMGVVVFDTADNARAALDKLKPPPGGPELVSAAVYEVGAEA